MNTDNCDTSHKTSSRKTKLLIQLYKCDDMYVNANWNRLKNFQVIMTINVSVHIQFNNYITHFMYFFIYFKTKSKGISFLNSLVLINKLSLILFRIYCLFQGKPCGLNCTLFNWIQIISSSFFLFYLFFSFLF